MRRISILASLMLVLAFALAACAGAGESTQAPGVTEPFDLTAMPPTGEPGGFPEITQPVVTATEPVVTPTVEATEPAITETAAPAETEVLPPTGKLDVNKLSVLMDFKVMTQDGEQVGDVDNFIMNLTNTRIDYVVVDSATFLDIGGRKIAVPWKDVEVQANDNGENAFVLKFSKDVFDKAPDFDSGTFPAIGEEMAGWDLYLNNYWDTVGTGTGANPAGQGTPNPGTNTATETPTAPAQGTEEPGQAATARLKGTILASDLIGMKIVDDNGESIGEIQDAIVNLKNGKVKYLVVQIDTADGSETHLLAVPVLILRWDADNQAFGFTVDRATLDGAPYFENGNWPDTGMSGWDDQILAYWKDFVNGLD